MANDLRRQFTVSCRSLLQVFQLGVPFGLFLAVAQKGHVEPCVRRCLQMVNRKGDERRVDNVVRVSRGVCSRSRRDNSDGSTKCHFPRSLEVSVPDR